MTVRAYFTPESLAEALALKAAHGHNLHVIAGGTVMMQQVNEGHFFPEYVMGLRRAGMASVQLNGQAIIGAAATMSQMEALVAFPLLSQAARSIGGWAIRNMATVGGNLFNQPPYGDFCTALLALDAQVRIQSQESERVISLEQFLRDGRVLGAAELVTELHVPRPSGRTVYHKFARRQSNAPTIVSVAAEVELREDHVSGARIALNGADSVPVRAYAAEAALVGAALTPARIVEAARAAAAASNPVTDPVASAWYRRQMVEVQLKRALSDLRDA